MQFVIGVYATQEQAERALVRLHEAGYSEEQVALIANVPPGTVPRAECRLLCAGRWRRQAPLRPAHRLLGAGRGGGEEDCPRVVA